MARQGIRAVSVYVTDEQLAVLQKAAEMEHRSLSNFLLAEALAKANALGVQAASKKAPRKRISR